MQKLIIDPEFKALIPPITDEEYAQLESSLLLEGCRDRLVTWRGILLDGHNRYSLITKHNLPFETIEKDFESREQAIVWIIDNQLGRRNLTLYVRGVLALKKKEMLAAQAKENMSLGGEYKGLQNSVNLITPINTQKELAKEAGISHDTLHRVEVIENKAPVELREKARIGEISINEAYNTVRKEEKNEELKEKYRQIEEQKLAGVLDRPVVTLLDAVSWLEQQESADLLLTDPPYSTDVDDIKKFAQSWLCLALSKVKPTGRAFICVGAYPEELSAYMSVAMPDQILVWTYRNTLGPQPLQDYKLNWQAVLYYRGKEAGPLDCPIMTEQFSVQDINAPDGRLGDRFHKWQKPLELGQRFIRHATKIGDIVIDPFCGTGTFLIGASELGRKAYGCDSDQFMLDIALSRGCSYAK